MVQSVKVDPVWLMNCRRVPFLAPSEVFDKYEVVFPFLPNMR